MRWYSACKNGAKQPRNTRRNAAHFFLESCSQSRNEYSASISTKKSEILGNFGGHCGDFGSQGPPKVTCRHPWRLRDDFFMVFDGFGVPFRVPGGALWGTFWCMFCEMDLFHSFLETFSDSEKGAKTELPKGGRHTIRSRRRMFREGRHLSTWHRFGLHFGSVLGAQVGTILRFGRPGVQIGCSEAVQCFVVPKVLRF